MTRPDDNARRRSAAAALALAGGAAAGLLPSFGAAEHVLGDRANALAWRAKVNALIADQGIEAATARLNKAGSRFRQARPHLAILRLTGDRVIAKAHTRFPELAGAEITQLRDLKGRRFIQDFVEAVRTGGGPVPVTNALPETDAQRHPALCSVAWAPGQQGRFIVVACYDDRRSAGP